MIKNRLKEIRMKEYMMNKKEFAKVLSIVEQQYLRYENGINMPSLEICFKISNTLSKKIDDIWYVENAPN